VDDPVPGRGKRLAHEGEAPLSRPHRFDSLAQQEARRAHRLFKAGVGILQRVPGGVERADRVGKQVAAAGVVVEIEGLYKPLVKTPRPVLPEQGGAEGAPQQAEGRIRRAVVPHGRPLLVVVEGPPADVESQAAIAVWYPQDAADADAGAEEAQKRG
jgi:hypothetical protein